ncbi:MAG TPA: histidine kinase [Puia sp.]|nr:histidine kinase [Puia sp.]
MLPRHLVKYFLFSFIYSFLSIALCAQEYNYTHYDVKDGLAGSTVYSIVQDKDGFMWYGTETGLSRFDGTHFKNFYTSDGLPDNEIIKLFVDSKNRVWIIPFKNSICYYWKGKIYNQQNDSLLKKINFVEGLALINEDSSGNVIIADIHNIYVIDQSNNISVINKFNGTSIVIAQSEVNSRSNPKFVFSSDSGTRILTQLDVHKFSFSIDTSIVITDSYDVAYFSSNLMILQHQNSLHLFYSNPKLNSVINLPYGFINISNINDTLISFNTVKKAYLFNVKSKSITDSLLKNQAVNVVAQDLESNLWISVPEKGVYKLASGNILNFVSPQENKSVFCIQKFDSLIYAGSDNFYLWVLNLTKKTIATHKIIDLSTRGRITSLASAGKNNLIAGTDNGIFRLSLNKLEILDSFSFRAIKSIMKLGNDKILTSSHRDVATRNINNLKSAELIWEDRSTCAYGTNDAYFVGTLNGLYKVDFTKKATYLGNDYKVFQSRINAITQTEDSILWIATNGNGLVAYKKDKIILNITDKNGLTSNICRTIFASPNAIWVGTDKGLNKVSLSDSNHNITPFTSADGLSSDIINAVYVDGNDVLVGTPEGLIYFDENKVSKKTICNLHITAIKVGDHQLQPDSSGFILDHKNNNISIQFVGISYKSGGKILYRYRLIGLDSVWKTTNETALNYLSLSSGKYELQIKAINKFGVQSNVIKVQFAISKRIWEKTGMRLLLLVLTIIFFWITISYRIKIIRKKANEKSETVRRIAELEQMALKSQMNPHFIFNCLNSIQHYVIDKDVSGANEFITNFARLIRLTLENSSKSDISIEDEVNYLTAYLELEQKRFENKFTFDIIKDPDIQHNCFIPPMILQPYVENAIRHGVRYRDHRSGKIIISFEKQTEFLVCSISDNGIGRKLSEKFKSKNNIEYQSKGMTLTAKRIEMLNKTHISKIAISINDLEDMNGVALGTEIIIKFPLDEIQKI